MNPNDADRSLVERAQQGDSRAFEMLVVKYQRRIERLISRMVRDADLVHEFFQGFVNHAQVTMHVDNLRGDNAHHQCETMFKAFARALRMAAEADPRAAGSVPSTKGSL